jgi:pimeloyl-ACP methyl ester carboxylesterase
VTGLLTFEYREIVLNYYKIGNGPATMLAFHGFGQDASVFSPLEEELGRDFTIYSINLFFHGSKWPFGEKPLEVDLLEEIFSKFLSQAGIERFSLIAYSIGAKFAMVISHRFSRVVDRILLLAPDGLKLNFWYRLATGTALTRSVFRFFIDHGTVFLGITKLAAGIRLVHASTVRFVNSQMANAGKREKVFLTWVVFRKLFIKSGLLASKLNENKVQIFIFIGEMDRIITPGKVQQANKLFNYSQLIILPVNHNQMIPGFIEWLRGRSGKL